MKRFPPISALIVTYCFVASGLTAEQKQTQVETPVLTPGEKAMFELAGMPGKVIRLWPDQGHNPKATHKDFQESYEPREKIIGAIKNVSQPSLILIPPPANSPKSDHSVLYIPGGGYGILGLKEGPLRWAHAMGAHFVVLKYSVPRVKEDSGRRIPLSDAQRGMRHLRKLGKELGYSKIIIMGASAGGHLCVNLSNNHEEKTYEPIDDLDQLSARPDAAVTLQPAYLTQPIESMEKDPNLNVDQANPKRTAPIFIMVTQPDKFVQGALNTSVLLRAAKVPHELHIYPHGGHLSTQYTYPANDFVRESARFLKDQEVITEDMKQASDKWLRSVTQDIKKQHTPLNHDFKPSGKTAELTSDIKSEIGDENLLKLAQERKTPVVLRLWPEAISKDGSRPDDPALQLKESLKKSKRNDGLLRITNVTKPTLHVWKADKPDGRSVIIFPGGGYNILAASHEGADIATWLNRQGITAFIAKYRTPRRKGLAPHHVALQDAQRAIRLVRHRAKAFDIDPTRIGVLGFSAGGNLAAMTVHHAHKPSYEPIDTADKVSPRPDFAVLIYPAYLNKDKNSQALSPYVLPLDKKQHVPTYIAVAANDPHALSAIYYMLHMHKIKNPAELHVYASGGHGGGLREIAYPFSEWTVSCERWLNDLNMGIKTLNLK